MMRCARAARSAGSRASRRAGGGAILLRRIIRVVERSSRPLRNCAAPCAVRAAAALHISSRAAAARPADDRHFGAREKPRNSASSGGED